MMPALILLSHGSRHPHAYDGIDALVNRCRMLLHDVSVYAAYLDFHEDSVEAVAGVVKEGSAVVVPLLFSSGYHAKTDVPGEISRVTSVDLQLADALGVGEDVARVLAEGAGDGDEDLVVYSVGSSRPSAREDVEELARSVEKLTGRRTHVVSATHSQTAFADIDGPFRVLPLFVTEGLLLDKARAEVADLPATVARPLTDALAPIVVERYRKVLQ